MAKYPDFNPWMLVGGVPEEHKDITKHTEVDIHLARAAAVTAISIRRAGQIAGVMLSVLAAGVSFGQESLPYTYAGFAAMLLGASLLIWLLAAWPNDNLLIDTFRRDIVDPMRDNPRRMLFERWLEIEQSKVQPPPPPDYQPILLNQGGRTTEIERAEVRQPTKPEHLLAFLQTANEIGWSRRAWCPENGPRVRLATGLRVQRKEWREYTEMAARLGFAVAQPDGHLEWGGDPDEIIYQYRRKLSEAWQPQEAVP